MAPEAAMANRVNFALNGPPPVRRQQSKSSANGMAHSGRPLWPMLPPILLLGGRR